MTMDLEVLECGKCESLKLGVHAAALGIAAICGLYNAAAWLTRREQHLAVNAVLYAALIAFEQLHVVHHIAQLRRPASEPSATESARVAGPAVAPPEPAIAA
jgi:hypothetical protein